MGSIRGESSTRHNMVNSLLFSSLLLLGAGRLAVGQWDYDTNFLYRSNLGEDRFTNDGTHNLKCYVPGQCQEFSVDFEGSQGPDECGKFCHDHNSKLTDEDVHRCNWWSWEAGQNLCIMFHNCTENGERPDGTKCPHCLTGQESCQQRQCVMDVKCKGHLTEGSLKQFTAGSLRECISSCSHHAECKFYTFQNNTNFCILYEDCDKDPKTDDYMTCGDCQTGEVACGLGHLPASIITEENGFLTNNTHQHALNVKFDETMRNYCEVEGGRGKFLVEDERNDQCKYFFDCSKELVLECDTDYAFDDHKEECYNIHENYKKEKESDRVMCKDTFLESVIYHPTHGGPAKK